MGTLRRRYYNVFSRVYDPVIRLHSGDEGGELRKDIARKSGVKKSDRVLDLCCGTGAVAIELVDAVGNGGLVAGLDFSWGMLQKAAVKAKSKWSRNLFWMEGDAGYLPFKDGSFNAVTCSHAMYELKGKARDQALHEIKRVLISGGRFCMMEHEVPKNIFIKFLFSIRMAVAGSRDSFSFLKNDTEIMGKHFRNVQRENSPSGKTRIVCGEKEG